MKRQQQSKFGITVSWLLAAATTTGTLHAGVIATNGDVPATMNPTTGSEIDPSVYVLDDYNREFGASPVRVGSDVNSNWVRLEVRNGASASTTADNSYIGADSTAGGGSYNQIIVTGTGSSISLRATRLGSRSSHNNMTLKDGASGTIAGQLDFGRSTTSFDVVSNSLVVANASLLLTGKANIGFDTNHLHNAITVRDGGTLTSLNRISVGRFGSYNSVTVAGMNSRVVSGFGGGAFVLGESATYAHHNTLTVQDQALVALTNATGTITRSQSAEGGSYVRFAGGIMAFRGGNATVLSHTLVQLWDGDAWQPAPGDWKGQPYTDDAAGEAAAFAATGYSGLAGFTVFTGGEPINPPPPLATLMIIK